MQKFIWFIAVLSVWGACSNGPSDGTDAGDATDTASDLSADVLKDTEPGDDDGGVDAADPEDVGSDMRDAQSPPGDMDAADSADVAVDVQPDAAEDRFEGRPLGQCTQNTDCPDGPNGPMCSRALPGGACLGCGNDSHCPGEATCSDFGTCVTECSNDEDCPPGTDCSASGRCGASDCVNDVCPVDLFGCNDSGRCERIDCSSDPDVCPAGTTCTDGRCIEDRALN